MPSNKPHFVMLHNAELDVLRDDPRALEVWAWLIRFADFETQRCFPSVGTLARSIGTTESTVRRAIQRLVNFGLVKVELRKNPRGDNSSNVYHLQRQKTVQGGSTDDTPRLQRRKK